MDITIFVFASVVYFIYLEKNKKMPAPPADNSRENWYRK